MLNENFDSFVKLALEGAGIFMPRQTRLSVRRVSGIALWLNILTFIYDQTHSKAMEFEEPTHNSVDPEVRAYVYSLVSAVSQALPKCSSS